MSNKKNEQPADKIIEKDNCRILHGSINYVNACSLLKFSAGFGKQRAKLG